MGLPSDVEVSPLDVADARELEAAFATVAACELAGVGWTDATQESVTATLTGPDAWAGHHLVARRDGVVVGLLAAEIDRVGRELFLDAFAVGPDAAQTQRMLLDLGLQDAARLARREPADASGVTDPFSLDPRIWQVVGAGYEQDTAYAQVLAGLGFRPIRRFWRMICDLAEVSAVAPVAPPGVTRTIVDSEADRRLLHALFRESFAEHFGSSHDHPFEEWIARVEAVSGHDPAGWWIAWADGRPAGLCIVDDSKAEFGEGYVRTLGVVPAARGRGIGRWLLGCAAADAVARGRRAIALAVDGQNTTGATALYESAGYVTRQVIDVWCYPLTDAHVDSARSR